MKTYYLLLITLMLIITACDYTGSTTSQVIIKNTSSHKVKILPYQNGTVKQSAVINLKTGEEKTVSSNVERDILGTGSYFPEYVLGTDSVIVLFDDSLKTIHFNDSVSISPSSFHWSNSPRSLWNIDKFDISVRDLSKKERIYTARYTFTEDDYLYAVSRN
ncbi:MAG: hypothetical protein ACM3ME_00545 [Chloroflexota bacterium]